MIFIFKRSLLLVALVVVSSIACSHGVKLKPKKKFAATPKIRRDIQVPGDLSKAYPPKWGNILKFPSKIDSKDKFQALPAGKRLAIMARLSVLHLTLLSCLGPLIVRGALRAGGADLNFTPWLNILWTVNGMSWHAFHNMLNDWQDLDDDDASKDSSYRRAYGLQALQERFVDKSEYAIGMFLVGLPAMLISAYFVAKESTLFLATVLGMFSMVAYTPLFKPFALGEVLIYLVWGPIMAGYGTVAAGGAPISDWKEALRDPISALFGLLALGTIIGKHTDKIKYSTKKTLPKLLGYPTALYACGLAVLLPHFVLLFAYLWGIKSGTQLLPWGAAYSFLTLFKEVPHIFYILSLGPPDDKPTLPIGTTFEGHAAPFVAGQGWPLWFVGATAWHAVTFGYMMVLGCGMEWLARSTGLVNFVQGFVKK